MGASRNKPKRCETCIFYKPSDLKGQGWCTHPKRQQSGGMLLLVRAGALDCRNSWGEDFWTPTDDAGGAAATATAVPPSDPIATAAHASPPPAVEDLVVRQDSIMHHAAQSTSHDDDSINHAALSDQEERAQVMARGAREAIQRARQRKKAQLSHSRQPGVAPMPSADANAGEWIAPAEGPSDDVVLSTRHQVVDPFKRSYGAPEPPVPSREMPADTAGIVSRYQDDRFDSVPEIRGEVELPRPAHYRTGRDQSSHEDAIEAEPAALPQNPQMSSYDLVLQRAKRFQLRTGARNPRRTIISTPAPAMPVDAEFVDDVDATAETRIDAHVQELAREPLGNDRASDTEIVAGAKDEEPDTFVMPDWDDDPDVSWLTAPSTYTKPLTRGRFHLPQISLLRHRAQSRPSTHQAALAAHDDVVEETAWTEPTAPGARADADDDPDWVDEIVPVEAYVAAQPAPSPADVSTDAYVDATWGEEPDDEFRDGSADTAEVAGYSIATRLPEPVRDEPGTEWDDWRPPADDRVTGEATVRHRPQPRLSPFDIDSLRARLFQKSGAADVEPLRAVANAATAPTRARMARETSRPAPAFDAFHPSEPDDDPDPDPGTGVEATLPAIEQHWSEPDQEFDLRAVVQRQDELLDMRIQLAPEVPRACRTCRSFRAADGGERGWCTNEWAFSHRRMVNADDLPCESSIGCWWLPADNVWLPDSDLAALAEPTPLVDRLLGRRTLPGFYADDEEPRRAQAR